MNFILTGVTSDIIYELYTYQCYLNIIYELYTYQCYFRHYL